MFTHSTHIRWALIVALAAALQGPAPPPAGAQTDTLPATSVGSGGLRLVMGHRWLDLTGLNERLAGAGLSAFDDVITDPGHGSRLESSGFLADVSLAMEYRFGEGRGLVVGLGVGYTRAMGGWDWKVDGVQDVTFGPDVAVEGLHLDVSLGGWGKSEG